MFVKTAMAGTCGKGGGISLWTTLQEGVESLTWAGMGITGRDERQCPLSLYTVGVKRGEVASWAFAALCNAKRRHVIGKEERKGQQGTLEREMKEKKDWPFGQSTSPRWGKHTQPTARP